ncbi:MAG TPA: polysaccharide biosynthesis protein [Firmicutes bacterium]|nr:polysaccharide biosynthesis protein [Bacillota bacterium]
MKRFTFLKNAFILTITSLLLRTVGIFFRVYLSNKIGAEGMGLYQLIVSIYVLASTFATSGISTAVTRLISEEAGRGTRRSIRRILRRAMLVSLLIGLASAAAMLFGAQLISQYWLRDMRAVPSLQILAFGLPFMGITSCLRGYFIARRKASSTSYAQMFEQLVRIGVILLIIDRFAALGMSAACAAVMIGDILAEVGSCLYLGIGYLRDRRRLPTAGNPPARKKGILRELLGIAVPITAGRYLNSALRTVENLLVPNCLTKYSGSKEQALSEFGMLKGMAMPILFFPSSFLSAFSTLLIPEISEAAALEQSRRVKKAVQTSLRVTLLLAIPISGVFALFAKPLGMLIYGSQEVGMLIGVLAPIMPFMYLESVVDGLLKGLNQQVSSLKYSVLNSVLRISAIFFLVPARGMQGFLFVMIVSNIFTSLLNIRRLLVVTGVRIQWGQWLLKPLLAMTAGGVASLGVQSLLSRTALPPLLILLPAAAAGVLLYGLLLFLFGCITREDFAWLRRR